MTRTKKLYGFRLWEPIPKWTDRLGKRGGRIVKIIPLAYCKKIQIVISNGDYTTMEVMLVEEFFERKLNNN